MNPLKDPTQYKEIKVRLPVDHHIKLHSIRILHGRTITDVVGAALEEYFRNHAEELHLAERTPGERKLL